MKQQILLVTVFEPVGTQCQNDILISHLKSKGKETGIDWEYDHFGRLILKIEGCAYTAEFESIGYGMMKIFAVPKI